MSNAAIFREVMAQYDSDRAFAAKTAEERRAEVYAKLPRLSEIDKELAGMGALLVKTTLAGDNGGFIGRVDSFRIKNETLQEEKNELLESGGYSKNYLESVFICSSCKDTGYIGSEKCKCLSKRLIEKHFKLSELGNSFERENFETFNINYYSEAINQKEGLSPRANAELAYTECLNFVKDFEKNFSNLLLFGAPGLGKTFLCNCVAKRLIESGYTVLYATAPKLFKKLADIHFNRAESETDAYAEMAINCDLLIIDDLGAEVVSQVTASELFNLINARFLLEKPVVISTNLSVTGLAEHYSDRIMSRIIGEYTLLKFFGNDIREAKRYT